VNNVEVPSRLHCGTAGCIAGRACMVALGAKKAKKIEDPETLAGALFGIDEDEAHHLFHFPYEEDHGYGDLKEEISDLIPGTRAYARVVAKAIDRCIERYENGDFL